MPTTGSDDNAHEMRDIDAILLVFDVRRRNAGPLQVPDVVDAVRRAVQPGMLPHEVASLIRNFTPAMIELMLWELRGLGYLKQLAAGEDAGAYDITTDDDVSVDEQGDGERPLTGVDMVATLEQQHPGLVTSALEEELAPVPA